MEVLVAELQCNSCPEPILGHFFVLVFDLGDIVRMGGSLVVLFSCLNKTLSPT